jgi:hypothetical protein
VAFIAFAGPGEGVGFCCSCALLTVTTLKTIPSRPTMMNLDFILQLLE